MAGFAELLQIARVNTRPCTSILHVGTHERTRVNRTRNVSRRLRNALFKGAIVTRTSAGEASRWKEKGKYAGVKMKNCEDSDAATIIEKADLSTEHAAEQTRASSRQKATRAGKNLTERERRVCISSTILHLWIFFRVKNTFLSSIFGFLKETKENLNSLA